MSSYKEVASGLLEAEMGEVPSSVREYATVVITASTSELASSSSACYLRAWRRFLSFCNSHNVHPLPPKVSNNNCYFQAWFWAFGVWKYLEVGRGFSYFQKGWIRAFGSIFLGRGSNRIKINHKSYFKGEMLNTHDIFIEIRYKVRQSEICFKIIPKIQYFW